MQKWSQNANMDDIKILNWSRVCNYEIINGLYVLKNDVWLDFEHNGSKFRIKVCKDLADEIFYKGLLTAGISRSKATVAKYAVQYLAGLHYGREHDDFGIAEYVTLDTL